MSRSSLRNLYTVKKTVTFELKSSWENKNYVQDSFHFPKTQSWKESLYNNSIAESFDEERDVGRLLDLSHEIITWLDSFGKHISRGDIDLTYFRCNKYLLEKINRDAYHSYKNTGFKITKTTVDGKTYKQDQRLKDVDNSLELFTHILSNQEVGSSFISQADHLRKQYTKVYRDYQVKFDSAQHTFSGKARYFGAMAYLVDLLLNRIYPMLEHIDISDQEPERIVETSKKLAHNLSEVKEHCNENNSLLQNILTVAQGESKWEVELTTLNYRAVNKDPQKIKQEIEDIDEKEQEIEDLDKELSGLNASKKEIVEELDQALIRSLPELHILDSRTNEGAYVQTLYQKQKEHGEKSLSKDEQIRIQEHKFAKTILKYIKLQGKVIANACNKPGKYRNKKKNGNPYPNNSKYQDIINYRQSGEKLNTKNNIQNIDDRLQELGVQNEVQQPLSKYQEFCTEKRKKSQKRGNCKQIYNALYREVRRQQKCNYYSMIVTDNAPEDPYFFLVMIPHDSKERLRGTYNLLTQEAGTWSYLDYHRFTFKALEKLALLEASTFDIHRPELRKRSQYIKKIYKEKQKNKTSEDQKYKPQDLRDIIDYCQQCIQSFPDSARYNFQFRAPQDYQSLQEFADDIDRQGVVMEWKPLRYDRLQELEQEGKILTFKIHNKDFRKYKDPSSSHKPNLFTQYWLDALDQENEYTRVLPEIDIYAQKKEKETSEKKSLSHKDDVWAEKRKTEDKLYASFRVEFYPEDEGYGFDQVNTEVKSQFTTDKTYFLGLDRGENELVTWCLIDDTGQLIDKGDWTTFTDEYGHETDFSKKLLQWSREALQMMEVDPESEEKDISEEKEKIRDEYLLENLKQGYCSYMIGELNTLLEQYPNTYIVLEDLDIQGRNANKNSNKEEDKSSNKEEDKSSNKEELVTKKLGAIPYQAVENAIVNKFKYHVVKDGQLQGRQTVPDIVKVEDLREVKLDQAHEQKFGKTKYLSSKQQVGNILFVDEDQTSKHCPVCDFEVNGDFRDYLKKPQDMRVTFEEGRYVVYIEEERYILPPLEWLEDSVEESAKRTLEEWLDFSDKDKTNKKRDVIGKLMTVRLKSIKDKRDKDGNITFSYFKYKGVRELDYVHCPRCGFSTENCNDSKLQNQHGTTISTGDDIAGYNIATRGLAIIQGK